MFSNNLNCVKQLIRLKKFSFSIDDFEQELGKHPFGDSLLGISEIFSEFEIENAAFRVIVDELSELPMPLLVHTNVPNSEFLVIEKIECDFFIVWNDIFSGEKINIEQLKKLYLGTVLVFDEVGELSCETSSKRKQQRISMRFLSLLISLFILANAFNTLKAWADWLIVMGCTTGLIVSGVLLLQSINQEGTIFKKLCNLGKKSNCNVVLSSDSAKAFFGLSWSDIGFIYFLTEWLFVTSKGPTTATLNTLALLSLFTLPYTIYSLYMQAFVLKHWCILCSSIQGILWLEFFADFRNLNFSAFPYLPDSLIFIILLLLIAATWLWLKPQLLQVRETGELKRQVNQLKFDYNMFLSLLDKQAYHQPLNNDETVLLGDLQSQHTITMVTHPFCVPCAATHKLLDEWLSKNKNFKLQLIFTSNYDDKTELTNNVIRHFLALNALGNKELIHAALRDWFKNKRKDYDQWASKYPVKLSSSDKNQQENHQQWCKMAKVTATPTLLLNGYLLPDIYHVSDLKYMLQ